MSHVATYSKPCGCGKRRYRGYDDALHAAIAASHKRHTPLRIYHCPAKAAGWHLTSKPKQVPGQTKEAV